MPKRRLMPDVVSEQALAALPPDASVRDAVKIMTERRVGALFVMEGPQLCGIFTERDVLVRIVAAGRDADTTRLSAVMTPNPDTLPPDATAADALHLMESRNYRHMPVVKDGAVLGMVSIRDLFAVTKRQLEQDVQDRDDFIHGTSYSPEAATPKSTE